MSKSKRHSEPKAHHFNPRMLQRRFTDKEGRLYFYNKRLPERGVRSSTPKKRFVERHLHTQYLDSGERDFSVEHGLSRLESEANGIIKKIVEKARLGKVPYLTAQEKETFDKFFYFQWKRVPDFLNERLPDHKIDGVILDGIEGHKAAGEELSPELQNIKNDPRTMSRIRHNLRAMAIGDSRGPVYEESLRRLAEMGLVITAIYDPNGSFIIGSRPILEIRDPEQSPDSDPSDMFLPLASDVAVQPYYFSHLSKEQVELMIASSDFIREINKAIMEQSTIVAGRSRELITSLVDGEKSSKHETVTQTNRIVGPGGRIYFRRNFLV